MWWMPSSFMTSRLPTGDVRLEAAHAGEPALVVVAAAPEELAHLGVREDQEALLAHGRDHLVRHLLRLDHLAGRGHHARPQALCAGDLEAALQHRRVHAHRTQAADADAALA